MKKSTIIIVLLVMALAFSFAQGSNESKSGVKYVVASDATWPPLEFVDESGDLAGFEIELAHEIGKATGNEIEVKNTAWDSIFAGLENGAYDGIASGVTITEDRKKVMDFATPFLNCGQVVIVPIDSTYTGIDDLSGTTVGVQIGTTGDICLDDYDVKKASYDEISLALIDMVNGNIDAAVCDSLIASEFVLQESSYSGVLKIVGEPFTTEEIAMCVSKGDDEFLSVLNEGMKILEENGKLADLKAKWGLY